MTLGNMRANGVSSLAVSCHLCHHAAVLSADPWPDTASARVRPARGLHPVRHHRCRRPAELAGATGTAERRWYWAMAMSAERHRALATGGQGAQISRESPGTVTERVSPRQ